MGERIFPLGGKQLRLGMLGFTEGDYHPYSWSAIINGYDREAMVRLCPTPVIPGYLNRQPPETLGLENVSVTHICYTGAAGRAEAAAVAEASLIPHVVERPEDMLDEVDAVLCATDVGAEHAERCRPFLEAGVPVFIDKPLTDSESSLRTFLRWRAEGRHFASSSAMRWSKELEPFYRSHYELGRLQYIGASMVKSFELYGIHLLEMIYPLLGPGFLSVQDTGTSEHAMVHVTHASGCDVHLALGLEGQSGGVLLVGTEGVRYITPGDRFDSFKKQLIRVIGWLRTGEEPVPFSETEELMRLVIGGLRSRAEGGRRVFLSEICSD